MKNTKSFEPLTDQEIESLVQSLPWDGCTGLVGGRLLATIQNMQQRMKLKDEALLLSLRISKQLITLVDNKSLAFDPEMYNYSKGM